MKFLLVLASLIAFTNALDQAIKDNFMAKVQEIGTECIDVVHASDDDVSDLLAHKFPPSTHEGKCLVFCIYKGFNIITDDGKIHKDEALKTLEPIKENDADLYEKSVKILDICFSSVELDDDPCITTINFATCALKEAKAMSLTDDLLF